MADLIDFPEDRIVRSPQQRARLLFWLGWRVADIARELDIPYQTVDGWKRREKWEEAPAHVKVESHAEARLCQLIAKTAKTAADFNEIDKLSKVMERTARIRRYEDGGTEADLNPKIKARAEAKQAKKNFLTDEQVGKLVDAFETVRFCYQAAWSAVREDARIRNILKSRQIGATWYFAREAIVSAAVDGDNQIFLSASKKQALVFRRYIVQFVREVTGVELKGDPIELWNGAELHFLGTNNRTAQSYHGHVYVDEYFWIPKFKEFRKVVSAMATHKQWRQTYMSTPSTVSHPAYGFWNGDSYNEGRAEAEKVEIDVSHAALKDGKVCPDGQWRQVVTVFDALAGGCDLFDLDALHREYNEQDFANLYNCEFIDDHISFFKLKKLQACMVDTWTAWADVDPFNLRPYDGEVWIGYDPSRFRDAAAIVVVAPPKVEGGFYRIIERLSFRDTDFETQAAAIKELCDRYRVSHIGIDTSTIGRGVFELVKKFFPAAMAITYSVEVKNSLVLRAAQIIDRRRLQFDAGWTDLASAFLTIRKTATASGRQTTFQADRSESTGHADEAWAVMHALAAEKLGPLDGPMPQQSKSFVEMY
jgi:uncharacterized protein YjcR